MIKNLVFLLEEKSARNMLEQIVPSIIDIKNISVYYFDFNGKSDLKKNIELKMRFWKLKDTFFIILQDQDANDCKILKSELVSKCEASGRKHYLVRIACRELESFYFGNLMAVERALLIPGLANKYKNTKRFRSPDDIVSPGQHLIEITKGKYIKTTGSTEIGKYLMRDDNKSNSFNILVSGIRKTLVLT
ncbi:MAG: DUF4276 family protein [Rickettsiales bacterium]|jgi:hypothetical protein|nr:DUF4276 family protein [Rickettsiales bacterium]